MKIIRNEVDLNKFKNIVKFKYDDVAEEITLKYLEFIDDGDDTKTVEQIISFKTINEFVKWSSNQKTDFLDSNQKDLKSIDDFKVLNEFEILKEKKETAFDYLKENWNEFMNSEFELNFEQAMNYEVEHLDLSDDW